MNKLFFVFVMMFSLSTIVLAQSLDIDSTSNYILLNRDSRWEKSSNSRLEQIINNPAKFNPEEFVASLHEYAKRHGTFTPAKTSLQAVVNAYIANNPSYMSQSTENVFIRVGKSRGVPSLQSLVLGDFKEEDNKTEYSEEEIYAADMDDEYFIYDEIVYDERYINTLLENYKKELGLVDPFDEGITDDGIRYVVFKVNENITATISTDTEETQYAIAKVKNVEAMNEAISTLTELFPVQITYINGGVLAFYLDTDNLFITDEMDGYMGTITLKGSQMFVEEVIPKNKIIMQRQWCTEDFYDVCTLQLGEGWGFIASWDIEE